jgi:hypothetical protein
VLQDAAAVALLRMGAPAIEAVMEAVEEDAPERVGPVYDLLGRVGCIDDTSLRERVMGFLESRVEFESRREPESTEIEALFRASASLGDRRQIPAMKRALAEIFRGRNPGIQDSLEMLEENTAGVPLFAGEPWRERYGWLFVDDREDAARNRQRRRRESAGTAGDGEEALPGDAEDEEDTTPDSRNNASRVLWGLSAMVVDPEDEEGYDARRHLARPGSEEEADSEDEDDEE